MEQGRQEAINVILNNMKNTHGGVSAYVDFT